jgi:glycosyltransferase involved in cell wall biosynthesis
MICTPLSFLKALILTTRMMRWSDRPSIWHLIYLTEACWIAARMKQARITHLHAHFGTNSGEVAMLVGVLANITYSLTIHGPEEFDRARSLHLEEKVKRAVFVIAISSFAQSQIFRIVDPKDWEKVKVIYCGIDRAFADLDSVIPSETNRFVCVARLSPEKGHLLLVRAFSALAKEGRKFELVLVGDGELREPIERLVAQNDLAGSVKLTGWASATRVKNEILNARALIMPSFAEGLPTVLVEAMALGRPVLSTYVAGIPELVIDGKAGWLFPAGSETALLNAVRACLDTPIETLKAMGEFARARALKQHNVKEQAERLSKLFEPYCNR